jgi:hypothetical protein
MISNTGDRTIETGDPGNLIEGIVLILHGKPGRVFYLGPVVVLRGPGAQAVLDGLDAAHSVPGVYDCSAFRMGFRHQEILAVVTVRVGSAVTLCLKQAAEDIGEILRPLVQGVDHLAELTVFRFTEPEEMVMLDRIILVGNLQMAVVKIGEDLPGTVLVGV